MPITTKRGKFSLHIDPSLLAFKFPHPVYAIVRYIATKGATRTIIVETHVEFNALALKHLTDPSQVAIQADQCARKNAELEFASMELQNVQP